MPTSDDTIWTVHGPLKISGKCHPACLLLPEMTEDEYRALVEDLRVNRQRHPIIVDNGGLILERPPSLAGAEGARRAA